MATFAILFSVGLLFGCATAISAVPSPSNTITSTYAYSAPPFDYSSNPRSSYTVTTPTTMWHPPTFATPAPLPACVDSVCPSGDKSTCIDSEGITYGVLCNTFLSGVVITNSGKLKEKEKRSFTGNFEGCTAFCDAYNKTLCTGVTFENGNCMAYDAITGTFPNAAGGFAALRQS